MTKVYGLKIYTRTTHGRNNGVYIPKVLGVIEGPVVKMIKAYPKEFSFMRNETTRFNKNDTIRNRLRCVHRRIYW